MRSRTILGVMCVERTWNIRRMKTLAVAVCLALITSLAGAIPGHAINGGHNAVLTPWSAKVLSGGLCTGSVIAPNWVLTAAHCVTPKNPGSIKIGEKATGNYKADRVIVHPSGADMALVHTRDILPVVPAALSPIVPPVGLTGQTSGWGMGRYPLQQGVSRVEGHYKDKARGNSQMFVVRSVEGNQEPGDSGGPFHVGPVVLGVTTAIGSTNSKGKIATNYVAVAPMIPWIISTMAGIPSLTGGSTVQRPKVQLPDQSLVPDLSALS